MGDIVIVSIVGAVGTVMGGVIVFFANKKLNNANVTSINTDTIIKLSERVRVLEERDEMKEKQIDQLQYELRRWKNGYARALRYIFEKFPHNDIPDFMKDTGDLKSQ